MEYIDILSTALHWYAIGAVAILTGSVIFYALAFFLYGLLVRLGKLVSRLLDHTASRVAVSWKHHHPVR